MPRLWADVRAPGGVGGLLFSDLPKAYASPAAGGQAQGRRVVPAMRGRVDRRPSGRRLQGQRFHDHLLRQVPRLLRGAVAGRWLMAENGKAEPVDAVEWLRRQEPGTMLHMRIRLARERETALALREEPEWIDALFGDVRVEARAGAMRIGQVLVGVLMVRWHHPTRPCLAETWLNAHEGRQWGGRRVFEDLARQETVPVLYVDGGGVRRAARMGNPLREGMRALLARCRELPPWSMAQFDAAREAVCERTGDDMERLWRLLGEEEGAAMDRALADGRGAADPEDLTARLSGICPACGTPAETRVSPLDVDLRSGIPVEAACPRCGAPVRFTRMEAVAPDGTVTNSTRIGVSDAPPRVVFAERAGGLLAVAHLPEEAPSRMLTVEDILRNVLRRTGGGLFAPDLSGSAAPGEMARRMLAALRSDRATACDPERPDVASPGSGVGMTADAWEWALAGFAGMIPRWSSESLARLGVLDAWELRHGREEAEPQPRRFADDPRRWAEAWGDAVPRSMDAAARSLAEHLRADRLGLRVLRRAARMAAGLYFDGKSESDREAGYVLAALVGTVCLLLLPEGSRGVVGLPTSDREVVPVACEGAHGAWAYQRDLVLAAPWVPARWGAALEAAGHTCLPAGVGGESAAVLPLDPEEFARRAQAQGAYPLEHPVDIHAGEVTVRLVPGTEPNSCVCQVRERDTVHLAVWDGRRWLLGDEWSRRAAAAALYDYRVPEVRDRAMRRVSAGGRGVSGMPARTAGAPKAPLAIPRWRYAAAPRADGGSRGGTHASPRAHQVGAFVRRLPTGWRASEAARRDAAAFGLQVPEGATFVRPHWRGLHGLPPEEAAREFYSRGALRRLLGR